MSEVWNKAEKALLEKMHSACDECMEGYAAERMFIQNCQVRKELRIKDTGCLYEIKVSIERLEP